MDMLKKSRNKSQGENTRVFIGKNMLCGFYMILQQCEWSEWGAMRFESSAKHVTFSNSLTNLALRKGFMTGFLQISWSFSFSVHFHQ